jgi:hydrogenase/urease accessory protein HupE
VKSFRPLYVLAATILLAFSGAASAHEGTGIAGGFTGGIMHPALGWDHVVTTVAVGLWGHSWACRRPGFFQLSFHSSWLLEARLV